MLKRFAKICCIYVCLIVVTLLLSGCAFFESEDDVVVSDYCISYLNRDTTKIVKVPYELHAESNDTLGCVKEFLDKLNGETNDVELVKAIPEGVIIEGFDIEKSGKLNLYFDQGYTNVDSVREILCRLALVQTLTQIDGVNSIAIYVGDVPLCDAKGYTVGAMTLDSFVENPGEQIDSIQNAKITLYFANSTGDSLVAEYQEVYYSSNTSLEKLVIEHLIKGPITSNAYPTIPEGTALVNVSVADRVCYVSLNEAFLTQSYDITEETVMYSIINSLTSLPHIDKVQVSVNGDTSGTYRDHMALDTVYEFDGRMVKKASKASEAVLDEAAQATAQ